MGFTKPNVTVHNSIAMMAYDSKWLEEDRQRVLDMERWYVFDGRHRPDNPMHGLYTGLADKGKQLDEEYCYS